MQTVTWIGLLIYMVIPRSFAADLPVLSEETGNGSMPERQDTSLKPAQTFAVTYEATKSEVDQTLGTTELTTGVVKTTEATNVNQTAVAMPNFFSPQRRCPWECLSEKCGKPPTSVKKVVGGITAKPFNWPWIGSIWANDTLLCGATLICQSWVLTAAHCFLDSTGRKVDTHRSRDLYLGRYRKRGSYKAVKKISLEFHMINVHSEYDILRSYNDIALISLPKPMKFSRRIFPACLPDIEIQPPKIGVNCRVAGWGATMGIGPSNNKLKEATVPLVSTNICKYAYYFSKTEQILCAGGGKHDPCAGDSGGPLICESASSPGKWEIQGVITFGASNCGTAKLPGIYAKVAHYLKWIRRTINYRCLRWRFLYR